MNIKTVLLASLQTVGLFAAGLAIPLLGQAIALLTPVPAVVASLRNSRREGLLVVVVSTAASSFLGGWEGGLIFLFSFGFMAVAVAEGMRRSLKPEQTALLGGLLPLAIIALFLAFYFIRVGKNPWEYAEAFLHSNLSDAAKLYTSMGLKEAASLISSVPDAFIFYFVRLAPGIAAATSIMQAACCYAVAAALIARRSPSPIFTAPPFSGWHAPDTWVWGLILSLLLVVIPQPEAKLAGWNLAIVFGVIYLAQGAAVVDFYLKKARFRAVARGFAIGLLLALPVMVFIIALGVVDIWADVRKVRSPIQS